MKSKKRILVTLIVAVLAGIVIFPMLPHGGRAGGGGPPPAPPPPPHSQCLYASHGKARVHAHRAHGIIKLLPTSHRQALNTPRA